MKKLSAMAALTATAFVSQLAWSQSTIPQHHEVKVQSDTSRPTQDLREIDINELKKKNVTPSLIDPQSTIKTTVKSSPTIFQKYELMTQKQERINELNRLIAPTEAQKNEREKLAQEMNDLSIEISKESGVGFKEMMETEREHIHSITNLNSISDINSNLPPPSTGADPL